jgi:hypothetical protein
LLGRLNSRVKMTEDRVDELEDTLIGFMCFSKAERK